jgi:hypothetical protein
MHLEIFGDGVHAPDTAGRSDGCELFCVAVDVPPKGHDASVDGDANVARRQKLDQITALQ